MVSALYFGSPEQESPTGIEPMTTRIPGDALSTELHVDCWQSVFLSKFQQGLWRKRLFSLQENGTRHWRLLPYSTILPYRSFAFAMTKHSSKLGRLSDPWRKNRLQGDYIPRNQQAGNKHHKLAGVTMVTPRTTLQHTYVSLLQHKNRHQNAKKVHDNN